MSERKAHDPAIEPATSAAVTGQNLPVFDAPFAPADEEIAPRLIAAATPDDAAEARIDARGLAYITAIRASNGTLGGVEDLLHEYALSTREGIALMMLAEALLRVPDEATADQLIEDKIADADWAGHEIRSDALLVSASAWGLALAARIVGPADTPRGVLAEITHRLGLPAIRAAARRAVRIAGSHFVLGETIEDALAHTQGEQAGARFSFDMLGEGARTTAAAARYFDAYAHAITRIGDSSATHVQSEAQSSVQESRPGISIKLSALHPRYVPLAREHVLRELTPRLIELAQMVRKRDLNLTIDAEEADRLELSLDLIAATLADASLTGWNGFGLAVQAYQKRASAVIDHAAALAQYFNRRLSVRLVKGAYWDTEVKRAQERGLANFPVFTRKAMTDLNFMACAQQLLRARAHLYPQFATHNALTVATLVEYAGGVEGYEFQRLHGMGEDLYSTLLETEPKARCRIYAPVGPHRDLLAYLVRRLLENGANSSFVARAADPAIPAHDLLERPRTALLRSSGLRHPDIALPADLFGAERANSRGVEFGARAQLAQLLAEIEPWRDSADKTSPPPITSREAVADIMARARSFAPQWDATPATRRADALERAANAFEARRGECLALLQSEGGKTLEDALAEVRETIDYCRYYAAQARALFGTGETLPGPVGEENILRYRGRGVFVCIAPWNFPLAIFCGQIAAALAAGNTVTAKPASQTPRIAALCVQILHASGVPQAALQLVAGDGALGAALVADPRVDGVAFTGSTATAWSINRALAAKHGPIAPLIAETGGVNAMIADATALPEQICDDVMASAFRSAGQRCSALRLLCIQDDIAGPTLEMIEGAARELVIGDPRNIDTDVGPVISQDAHAALTSWVEQMRAAGRRIAGPLGKLDETGSVLGKPLFAPHIVWLDRASDLSQEVFGPVLHVVRWRAGELDQLLCDIEASGYGLTLGIHSRIDPTIARISSRLRHGNIYVNRSMIGAVVGSQPFGGSGLSGTGPKAGGPNYLHRFAIEQTISTNTAAAGGNAALLAGQERRKT